MPEELATRRLRTFFVGTETSHNPLLPKLREFGRLAVAEELCDGQGALSARYGKRVLITTGGVPLDRLSDETFVEIVDYDPSKNRCLLMGRAEPSPEAGVHWLIYSNREEIGGIVQVHDPLVLRAQAETASQMFPETKEPRNAGNLELAVEALKLLRKSPYFVMRGRGSIAVGRTPDEAFDVVRQARGMAAEFLAGAPEDDEAEDDADLDEFPPPPPGRQR